MRDNPVHTVLQFLVGGIPDQLTVAKSMPLVAVLLVTLYWSALVGGIVVAVLNWRRDPAQRTAHAIGVFVLRMTMAGMWWLGILWKLPLPVSDGFKYWLGQTVKGSALTVHADIMQVFLDHIAIAQPLVFLLELSIGISLMMGFLVRASGTLAALFTLNLLIGLYNVGGEWPWTYVGIIVAHGMFALEHSGRFLGLDNLLRLTAWGRGRSFLPRAFRTLS